MKLEWLEVRRTKVVEIIVDGIDLLKEVRKLKEQSSKSGRRNEASRSKDIKK